MHIASLRSVLEEISNTNDEKKSKECLDELKILLKNFRCSNDFDVQEFLNNKAIDYDINHRTRTYLCLDNDYKLIAYFSVTLKNLDISNTVSKNYRKRLSYGFSKTNHIPAYLIAQLGKDDNCLQKGILNKLLDFAFKIINRAKDEVGGRVVYLECKKNDKVKNLYIQEGFNYIQDNKDLLQMVQIL